MPSLILVDGSAKGAAMTDQRVTTERREENKTILAEMHQKIESMHERLYNGLGKELRQEIKEEISGVRTLVIGILVALILALAGIVIEGRFSSNQSSLENDRSYKAIVDIGAKLEEHIIITGGKP
jgi:hypothetical protein